MKNVSKAIALSLFALVASLGACVAPAEDERTGEEAEVTVQYLPENEPELSSLIANIATHNASAACPLVFECQACGPINRTRNILVNSCTGQVVSAGACGRACF